MSDADWLAAVAAAPDDPLVRLAYADWLDDHADPRAELLRLDVALAGLADDDSAAGPLRIRLAELANDADVRWRAAVCRVPVAFDGWEDFGRCDCEVPGELAPGLFATDEEGYHMLARQPLSRAEVRTVCQAAVGCARGGIYYSGTDPVVERLAGLDSGQYVPAVVEPPPAPAPAVYGSPWAGIATSPSADPELPPNPRTVALIGGAIWTAYMAYAMYRLVCG